MCINLMTTKLDCRTYYNVIFFGTVSIDFDFHFYLNYLTVFSGLSHQTNYRYLL